ncbi:MAG: hypothetical protein HY841_07195 [Bacteroidetes bacterium]|nr:hypothetical protein [Bacteroidota bacterium]
MENYLEYILPVLALALLAAGWVVVQIIAKKMGTKNHFDYGGGCCGDCEKKDTCTKSENLLKTSK